MAGLGIDIEFCALCPPGVWNDPCRLGGVDCCLCPGVAKGEFRACCCCCCCCDAFIGGALIRWGVENCDAEVVGGMYWPCEGLDVIDAGIVGGAVGAEEP